MMLKVLLTSSVLIVGIFCLRKLTLGKISMRLRYGLWLLAAVRLLVPVSVGTSAFSVMNLMPETFRENTQMLSFERENGWKLSAREGQDSGLAGERNSGRFGERNAESGQDGGQTKRNLEAADVSGSAAQEYDSAVSGAVRKQDSSAAERGKTDLGLGDISRRGMLRAMWLMGFLAAGGYMILSRHRFVRYLYRNRRELSAETVPDAFAERLSRRKMKVYQVRGLPAPCLVGRCIYIGESVALQEQNLMHVLVHEYCHALHGDGLWAFLRCLLAAVYWFDPLVWAAAYAARQDSELACDEAAVKLLGESSRYAYGRTLLALLESAGGREKCPGTSFMTEGGEGSVRERILALTEGGRTKKPVYAAVLAAMLLICGCAFTGAEQDGANAAGETGGQEAAETGDSTGSSAERQGMESTAQERQMVVEEESAEFTRIQEEYGEAVKEAELLEEKRAEVALLEEQISELEEIARQEMEMAAFLEVLNYHGVMEGKDDGELALNREVDYQTYYEFTIGEAENPMETGWYRVCENEDAGITLYGLYTEEFGFRGVKTLIGEDVNTYDIRWCSALANGDKDNILVLERADDGLPRRFVWKLPVEDSSKAEIWRLYSGYRYDTGTVEVKMLSEEECLAWANEHVSFDVDQEAEKVYVIWDGDEALGSIDISTYAKWTTEYMQLVPDIFGVMLDDRTGEDAAGSEGGLAVQLVAGLKFKDVDGLWFADLPILTIPVNEDGDSESGFRLQTPRIDDQHAVQAPWQERELEKIQNRAEETGRE